MGRTEGTQLELIGTEAIGHELPHGVSIGAGNDGFTCTWCGRDTKKITFATFTVHKAQLIGVAEEGILVVVTIRFVGESVGSAL